jgi:aminoglycoside phosphotransferase family enzyme/predicted kinase
MGTLRDDLATADVDVEETHLSLVLLHPADVYKIKKSVDLGFADFSTLAARRSACEAEVELNRRLAPDVYLGLVPITVDAAGRHQLDGEGEIVDWAVHMRRLPLERRADTLLAAGTLDRGDLVAVADLVAGFHDSARCDEKTAAFGAPQVIAGNVRENFAQTRDHIHRYLTPAEALEIEERQTGFLESCHDLFEERARTGRVRDGHGDLRLEHLYLERRGEQLRATIVDCIEFNERFRYADVCADVAFLSMDLAWHGHAELAELFLARYALTTNDYDFYALADFYQGYRAYVRGKVAAMLAADETAAPAARRRADTEAHRYFKLALAAERPSLLAPVVVAVGGSIASGKSTVATWIGDRLSAAIVGSDRTRKSLLGVAPTEKVHVEAFTGPYTPEASEHVYAEVLRRAGVVLSSGRAVVVDASFRSAHDRRRVAELAARHGVDFHFVECRADPATLRERLEQRELSTGVSDGRLEILDDFLARWEAVDELPRHQHLEIDTAVHFDVTEARLREQIALWPSRLTG